LKTLLVIFFIIVCSPALYSWQKFVKLDTDGRHELSFEIDPYYSYFAYTFGIAETPIPEIQYTDEFNIYLSLLKNFYRPRFVLTEASIYPLPLAGVYIKKNRESSYEDSQATENINIVKAVTAGFPEPWASSVFFGNVINFTDKNNDGKNETVGKAFSGFLVSYGNRHIVDNIMVEDDWVETEIKLKGSDIRERRDLSWSYAVGYKWHRNNDINDKLYISIKRSRVDYGDREKNIFIKFFIHNSETEVRLDFNTVDYEKKAIVRYFFLFGKKFALSKNTVFSFGLGAIKTESDGYRGDLKGEINENWQLIFRPNMKLKF